MISASERGLLGRVVRDPLLHFGLVGAAIFALYVLAGPPPEPSEGAPEIVVDEGVRAALAVAFEASAGRAPDADEAAAAEAAWLDDEVLYRAGLELGLDREDTIVRRRVVQKMEFLLDEQTQVADPTSEEIESYIAASGGRFGISTRYTITQIFYDPARDASAEETAMQDLAALRAGESSDGRGVAFARGPRLVAQPYERFRAVFGGDVADAVRDATVGDWIGPVRSAFGLHLIKVEAADVSAADVAGARERASLALRADRLVAARAAAVADLRSRFTVVRR